LGCIEPDHRSSLFVLFKVVADAGFEPASPNGREILSLLCIPFHQSAILLL
jgi:hypothetical protein